MNEQSLENTATVTEEELPFNYSLLDYAKILREEGKTDDELRTLFAEKGHSENMVERVLAELNNPTLVVAEDNSDADKDILYGALWLGGGLLVTIGSYAAGGSRYIITYGAIIYGAIKLIGGISKKSR